MVFFFKCLLGLSRLVAGHRVRCPLEPMGFTAKGEGGRHLQPASHGYGGQITKQAIMSLVLKRIRYIAKITMNKNGFCFSTVI